MEDHDLAEVLALSNGARFVRGDLHVHSTVGSHDVSDASATPEAIVAKAISEGLEVLAIADHNEIEAVERSIVAAIGKPILVVPAVELSTSQGHLLCYLPDLEALRRFYAQLTLRDRGTGNSRVENGMVDCLDKLASLGGFGVLAHVDGPKGLDREMPGGSPHKLDILSHVALFGIELKNATSSISYTPKDPETVRANLGQQRNTRLGGTGIPLARVLNSDAHTLQALGRNAKGDNKVTRFKLQTLTFEALKLAFMDPESRVRLEDEIPRMVPVVTAIRLRGGFLKDQAIHFSPNLNCIIGGRGTGKSTAFEALRAFSAHPSGNSVVNSDVWPDHIDVSFTDEVGAAHLLVRSKGDEFCTNVNDPLEGPDSLPFECYGQGETQKISQRAQDDPAALLSYLDRFTDVVAELDEEEKARRAILAIEDKVSEARKNVGLIPQYERDLAIKRQQIKKMQEGKAKDIIALSRQLQQERQSRNQILENARLVSESLDYNTVKKALNALRGAADPSSLVVGKDEYAAIALGANQFEAGLSTSEGTLKQQSTALSELVRTNIASWVVKEKVLLNDIENRKASLEAQGLTVNTDYINKLTEDEASLAQSVVNLKTWEPELTRLEAERDGFIAARWRARDAVTTKRKNFATAATGKLRTALTDLNVTLKFEGSGLSPQAYDLLVEIMGWRTTQVQRATLLTQTLTVPKLLDAVRRKDAAPIQALKTIDAIPVFNKAEAQKLIEELSKPDVLSRLETSKVFDRPRLTVTRAVEDGAGRPKYIVREFGQLSLGQQQSVLLALMLSSESPNPLLIDQPEDNLDSEFIFAQLVPVIRLAKERRQIIIVTHNANIAVLGDAEQILVLKANSERATIASRGSIDEPSTKEAACAILEGARVAFVRRGKVYGL